MAGEPQITLTGNITDDPELRFTPSGAAVANFTVVVNSREKQGEEWVDGEPSFYRCAVWREMAENVAETLTRGMRVVVVGRQKIRRYETQDGKQGTSVDIEVDSVGPDLRWATAKVTKAAKKSPGGGRTPARQAAPDPWASNDEPPF